MEENHCERISSVSRAPDAPPLPPSPPPEGLGWGGGDAHGAGPAGCAVGGTSVYRPLNTGVGWGESPGVDWWGQKDRASQDLELENLQLWKDGPLMVLLGTETERQREVCLSLNIY